MNKNSVELNRPAVDWLTLTTFSSSQFETMENGWRDATGNESPAQPTRRLQYTGYTIDEAFFGVGHQQGDAHFMVMTSGGKSDMVSRIAHRLDVRAKCSRIDLQITIEWPDDQIIKWYLENRESGRVSVSDSPSGTTLYVGSRKSDRFVRIYKKIDGVVRFEVELKGKVADATNSLITEQGEGAVASVLLTELSRARKKVKGGIQAFFDATLTACEMFARGEGKVTVAKQEPQTMKWLRATVESAIIKQANDHDNNAELVAWLQGVVERVNSVPKGKRIMDHRWFDDEPWD